ncbi:hypothetical protein PTI98_000696 [Pleurotus ostreatus]|nr:hypothetical protein PTI98_000696 [Pleurotus ostreatus]
MVLASMMSIPNLRRLHQDLGCIPQNRLETETSAGSASLAKVINTARITTESGIHVVEGECSQDDFEILWSQGLPLMVRGAPGLLYDWSPTGLSSFLGDDACDIVECETNRIKRTTINTFLQNLGKSKTADGPPLKLKDYPEDMLFKDKSPILARDFKSALPVPMYTYDDGPLNLAAMYPLEYDCKPDIGNVYIDS